jgi:hypothetical protein
MAIVNSNNKWTFGMNKWQLVINKIKINYKTKKKKKKKI